MNFKYFTPSVIASFLVVSITGVLMFFHIKAKGIVQAHEWIGLFLVAIGIVHAISHIKSVKSYVKDKFAIATIGLILFISLGIILGLKNDKNPTQKMYMAVENSSISSLAPIFGESSDKIISDLRASGISVNDENTTIKTISKNNNKHPKEILSIILN